MSQIEKLLQKFFLKPEALRYADIEKILVYLEFEKIPAKGSHVKWKHRDMSSDIIVPVHNHECKSFYKQQIRKQIQVIIKNKL